MDLRVEEMVFVILGYLIHSNTTMFWRELLSLYKLLFLNSKTKTIGHLNLYTAYVGYVYEYDPIRLRKDFKTQGVKIVYQATYSWNWHSKWKNLNRIFKPFFFSFL